MLSLRFLKTRKTPPAFEEGHALLYQQKIFYTVHRKPRRRKIALYIEPTGRLRFIAPLRTRTLTIDNFLHSSREWVLGKLSDLQNNPSPSFPHELRHGATLHYLGKPYQLVLTHNVDEQQTCNLKDQELEINLPQARDLSEKETQEEIRLKVILWYKKQARQILKARTEFWATQMDLRYRSLKITNPTRQWGSCTAKNDIRLNWRVVMAPMDVIDYLIVHELAHIAHKNHSIRFWNYVVQFLPHYKTAQRVLKRMDSGFSI